MPRLLLLLFFSIITIPALRASAIIPVQVTDTALISSGYIIIREITIEGNRKTKEGIILRELSFKTGDTISASDIEKMLLLSRNRIFNTGLFITTHLVLSDDTINKTLFIRLKERFYTYPLPIFELADRNFNEWWQQRGHDIHRTNIGINFQQKNVRGRNETLKIKAQAGFTKKLEFGYFIPYLNKNQKTGLNFTISYSTNKQVAYKTSEHKLTYTEVDHYNLRKRFYTSLTLSHRNRFYQTHFATLSFFYNTIADTIATLNPRYFLRGKTTQRYFSFKYSFVRDFRDRAYYPLKGSYFRLDAEKLGFGFDDLNQIDFRVEYNRFFTLGKKFFLAAGVKQKLSWPYIQPYYNFKSMGYDRDYVSGYELYVIDGQHFSLAKLNLKYQLFSTNLRIDPLPFNQFKTVPFAIYLKAYSDGGYVVDQTFNPENTKLANKFLLGGGLGLDFVTYYDLVLRVEYSINRLQQQGFFLHMKAAI